MDTLTDDEQAIELARALRALRESHWPDTNLTQAQVAKALSVAPATISSWESTTAPKTPTEARLRAYARFFASRRSLNGTPHLIPERELQDEERENYHELTDQLLDMLASSEAPASISTLAFRAGPVTIICPETPEVERGPLADESHPNFNGLQQYADLDALFEMHGHLRAANPTLDVYRRLPAELKADDLSTHIIVLGGIGWNNVTRRIQAQIAQMPITQIDDPDIIGGDIFTVEDDSRTNRFLPVWAGHSGDPASELLEDVALLARMPNPFNISRTLTICNGIYSRGVLGAVRCLTDAMVRDANEQYLAERFTSERFAMLLRVPVVANRTMTPDLQNPDVRLFEWPPRDGGS